eukprot:9597592-Lingulodinium_polyedra.AAC.1
MVEDPDFRAPVLGLGHRQSEIYMSVRTQRQLFLPDQANSPTRRPCLPTVWTSIVGCVLNGLPAHANVGVSLFWRVCARACTRNLYAH